MSTALLPLSWLYGAIGGVRRRLYRCGVFDSTRLPVPVIVVGNVVAGGAGKTPLVLAVVELLRRHGERPGVVSRGYGRSEEAVVAVEVDAKAAAVGDEPLLLRRRGGVPVFVGARRVDAARALLLAHPEVSVIVADDGLQHLALQRDVEIVVFDERGLGNGRLLPAGPLREPMVAGSGRRLVVYNADRPTTPWPGFVSKRRLGSLTDLEAWWSGALASLEPLTALRDRPVLAVAGIARPERFFALLRDAGLAARTEALPDHASFATLPWAGSDEDVIVTEKDAVKLLPGRSLGARVWVAALDFAPEPAFEAALLKALAGARPPASH
ncbi:MAG: tetraacyldisaccharide 4'-kinase [Pseudomonadota bacterium]|nr:tetraacyldisaccharide 4'-kinase [Pseudomonadota bacterium]